MVEIIVVGGKGTALNVAEQIEDARLRFDYPMKCLGLSIDDESLGREIAGFPVLCATRDAWARYSNTRVQFLYCLYRPDVLVARFRLMDSLRIPEDRFARFIHPQAYVSRSAALGAGSIVMSGASIQQGVLIGRNCIINSGVVVEHEARIGNGCFLAANACIGARVCLGASVFIGLSANVREDVQIGDGAFVGMASTVLGGVAPGSLVYGTPAS